MSVNAQTLKINTVVGNGIQSFSGDGAVATNAGLAGPLFIDFDTLGNYYILDYWNRRVRMVNSGGIISTVAGNGSVGNTGDGALATNAAMGCRGMAVNGRGDIYISDEVYGTIRKVTRSTGIITRVAGNGTYGYSGDGGPATAAQFKLPFGIALDNKGNVLVADAGAHCIRKVTPTGTISTIAGNGTAGFFGDGGLATAALLDSPYAVAVDKIGNIFISDHGNNVVRKIDTFGMISTFAGTYITYGNTGDGGPANAALLRAPSGIAFDNARNVYIADADNHRIRRVDTFGMITSVIATGTQGFGGDGGPAISAQLDNPYDLAFGRDGSIYIADANNQRIRKVYLFEVGVDQAVNNSNIKVFPNPTTDNAVVEGLEAGDKVTVYDVTGKVAQESLSIPAPGTRFLLKSTVPGTYLVMVYDSNGNWKTTVKFVKQ